jgi:hypothetical protein
MLSRLSSEKYGKGEEALPNLVARPGQATPMRLTLTKRRQTPRGWKIDPAPPKPYLPRPGYFLG